jgi:hypothetical protein
LNYCFKEFYARLKEQKGKEALPLSLLLKRVKLDVMI